MLLHENDNPDSMLWDKLNTFLSPWWGFHGVRWRILWRQL